MLETDKILKKIRDQIEELVEKAKDLGEDAREDLDESIEELKKQRDKLEDKLKDFKTKNEPKFEETKHHISKAAEELELAVRKLFRKGPGAEEL